MSAVKLTARQERMLRRTVWAGEDAVFKKPTLEALQRLGLVQIVESARVVATDDGRAWVAQKDAAS